MELNLEALGRKIRFYRRNRGWKQRELAERVGVTDEYISHIQNARAKPSLDKTVAIANALGVDMNTLIEDSLSNTRSAELSERLDVAAKGMSGDKLELTVLFCEALEQFDVIKIRGVDDDEEDG